MLNFWKKLSVAHKLYGLIGVMALLICVELYTLRFAVTTLSAVRAFVGGEGMWSKAQKSAVFDLQAYALTRDDKYYANFLEHMKVPLGDHRARMALQKQSLDMNEVTEGFLAGKIHPDDIPKMVHLVREFHDVSYLANALDYWARADVLLLDLHRLGEKLKTEVEKGRSADSTEIADLFRDISQLDTELTYLEDGFSSTLGVASRWLERTLVIALICLVIVVEGTGLFLTVTFARSLSRVLKELVNAANKVGQGDFSVRVPVQSHDELGTLAESLNNMTSRLQNQVLSRMTAEEASKTKNLFLANMSHEIRTPLNAVLGFAELLHSPDLTQKEKDDYLDIIRRTGSSLTSIINDILDITRIEAGEVEIELSAFSLTQLISDIECILQVKCREKGIQLHFYRHGYVADFIRSDVGRLRQILTNIIGNAVKFTGKGGIRVTYQVEGAQLVFSITDTGPGITEAQLGRLFQPFSQGDDSVRKKHGGTGLGLQISQRLAHLMGGDLKLIRTEVGVGSTFMIQIPYWPTTDKAAQATLEGHPTWTERETPLKSLLGKHILICEDSPDNQFLAQKFLSQTNASLDFVSNGEEALLRTNQKSYDLILMDMQMPVLDGFAATQNLRRRGVLTPIIAITGYAMNSDRDKCFSAGCSAFLPKPYNREALLRCISKWL